MHQMSDQGAPPRAAATVPTFTMPSVCDSRPSQLVTVHAATAPAARLHLWQCVQRMPCTVVATLRCGPRNTQKPNAKAT